MQQGCKGAQKQRGNGKRSIQKGSWQSFGCRLEGRTHYAGKDGTVCFVLVECRHILACTHTERESDRVQTNCLSLSLSLSAKQSTILRLAMNIKQAICIQVQKTSKDEQRGEGNMVPAMGGGRRPAQSVGNKSPEW